MELPEFYREINGALGILFERQRSASRLRATHSESGMWQRFNNLVSSLQTYDALSPDLKVRQQVNRSLRKRPAMNRDQWLQSLHQAHGILYPVASFAYEHLSLYSGLDFGRILPSDRLHEDLCWTQVCWFDWELKLVDDFFQHFSVDISECLDQAALLTVQDLVVFLNHYGNR